MPAGPIERIPIDPTAGAKMRYQRKVGPEEMLRARTQARREEVAPLLPPPMTEDVAPVEEPTPPPAASPSKRLSTTAASPDKRRSTVALICRMAIDVADDDDLIELYEVADRTIEHWMRQP